MNRRIISLILISALLANQTMLCCAHAHAGIEGGDSSARPHIHLSGHAHHHGCGCHHHHHGDCLDHHHHDHEHDDADQSHSETSIHQENSDPTAELLESLDLTGHDEDAVYITNQADLHFSVGRIAIVKVPTASIQWPVVERVIICGPDVAGCKVFPEAVPLGFFSAAHCAIFLQTARLLI